MSHYDPTAAIPSWGIWGNLRHVIGDLADRTTNRGLDVTLSPYNAVGDGVADDTAAIQAAIDDADAAGVPHSNNHAVAAPGRTLTVYAPPGTYLTRGIVLDGRNVNLVGAGPAATRFRAHPDITGYVVSMDDWTGHVAHHRGSGPFGNFSIEGTHQADPSKARGGLHVASTQVHMENVSVFGTGGPAIRVDAGVYLSDFDHLILQRPVGADINDVPYLHILDSHNGNMWNRLGLRSVTSEPDGSAVVKVEGLAGSHHDTAFLFPWLEFQHTPEGGAIFDIGENGGGAYLIDGIQSHDVSSAVENPTSNCYVRLRSGGNELRYTSFGRGTASTNIAWGTIVDGSSNRIVGRRGYRDHCVLLNPGADFNHIELGGMNGSTPWAAEPAVVDNSGQPDNTILVWTEDNSPPAVLKYPRLPLVNPAVAGQLWNDAGTLKVSAG